MGYIHGGRAVARALACEGISHVLTLCGGHVHNIYDGCIDEGVEVVDVWLPEREFRRDAIPV